MRFVIVSAVAAVLGVGAIAPAISQGSGQPAATRAYMVEPYTPSTPITINGAGVRLRAEPFTGNTPVLSSGSTGLLLTVVGIVRQPDWNWYQVVLRNGPKAFSRSAMNRGESTTSTFNASSCPPRVRSGSPAVLSRSPAAGDGASLGKENTPGAGPGC